MSQLVKILKAPLTAGRKGTKLFGEGSTYGLTYLLSSPGFLLDYALPKNYSAQDYELETLNLIGEYPKTVYRGGFFSKYPLGLVARPVAAIAGGAIGASVFLATVITGYALLAAAPFVLAALALAAALIMGLVLLVRSCMVGPAKAASEMSLSR